MLLPNEFILAVKQAEVASQIPESQRSIGNKVVQGLFERGYIKWSQKAEKIV